MLSNYVISLYTWTYIDSVSGIFPPVVRVYVQRTVRVLRKLSLSYPWLFRVQAGTDVLRSIIVHYRQLNHRQSVLIFCDLWALIRLVKHLPHAISTAKSCLAGAVVWQLSVQAVNLALQTKRELESGQP